MTTLEDFNGTVFAEINFSAPAEAKGSIMKPLFHPLLAVAGLVLAGCTTMPARGEIGAGSGDPLRSSLERDASPEVGEDTLARLAADNRAFAFDLFHRVRETDPGKNLFFSPHSISLALAMTGAGASGETREQLTRVLRFSLDEEKLHRAFNALALDLDTRSEADVEDGDPPTLRIVNAAWAQDGYPFRKTFLDTLSRNYGSGVRPADFINNPEENRQRINQWVEEQTEDRIENLLPEGSIDGRTRLVLTNAIYFLAGWQQAFSEHVTSDRAFTLADGSQVEAPLMRQNETFAFYLGEDTRAAALPYVGGDLSFIALKPADPGEFDTWLAGLDEEHFTRVVEESMRRNGTISLPRFELKADYDLKSLFTTMGWTDYTQLERMVEEGGPDDLEISDILHKSYIAVDEEGTEAAAATAVAVRLVAAPEDPVSMDFDRPFVFIIYDHPTGSVLFLGTMMNPLE